MKAILPVLSMIALLLTGLVRPAQAQGCVLASGSIAAGGQALNLLFGHAVSSGDTVSVMATNADATPNSIVRTFIHNSVTFGVFAMGTIPSNTTAIGATFTFSANATIYVDIDNFTAAAATYTITLSGPSCGGGGGSGSGDLSAPPAGFTDGRLNKEPDMPVAVYCEKEVGGVTVYNVVNGSGEFAFHVSRAELERLPGKPLRNLLIRSKGDIRLYKLTSGQLNVTARPLSPGKPAYTFTWDNGC